MTFKLAALDFLKTNSVEKTAREFSVDPFNWNNKRRVSDKRRVSNKRQIEIVVKK